MGYLEKLHGECEGRKNFEIYEVYLQSASVFKRCVKY